NHVEAMRLLARIGVAREVLDDAEILLAAALEMAPDYLELRRDYACVLLDRHKHAEAIEQLDRLLKLDPQNIDYRVLRATATVGLGDHEGGIRGFTAALADTSPRSRLAADLHLSIGHSLKTLGRRTPAIEAYKQAIAARPKFGDAYWSLANLKTYTFSAAEIAQLEASEADPSTDELDRYHLCVALGKAHEDRGEYEESWHYYERGNALKRAASRYRAELVEQNTARQKQVCTHAFFRERNGYGAPSREPIFILGLPRAGSTLLEPILASCCRTPGSPMRAASRWLAASGTSSNSTPAARSSPTAWMTSRGTIAPTSSSWSTGTRCYPVGCCASTTRTSSRISRGACGGCSSSASCPSSWRASSTTEPRAASARRAPSRCVSRSFARVSSSGSISSAGSGH